MPLIQVIVILVIIGILLWLLNNFVPMDGKIKQILNAVVVIAVILWLVGIFVPGIWSSGPWLGGRR